VFADVGGVLVDIGLPVVGGGDDGDDDGADDGAEDGAGGDDDDDDGDSMVGDGV
jgi:hypothetical protein